jgi:GT2 family glycosyltransferase
MAAAPGISVVVPACGRIAALRRCLAALAAQQPVAGGLEVVVSVDGPAPDAAAVREAAPPGLRLTVLQSDRTGPAGARNRGAQAAAAPLLAFVDDDCEPDPGWAAALVASLERERRALVGGPVVNADPRDSAAAASHAVLAALYETDPFLASANLALRADAFAALEGFDESFPTAAGEDREFCARAVDRGVPVVYVPDAPVIHHRPSSTRHLWRQYAEYGRGARRLARRRADAGQPPVRAGRGFPRALARSTLLAARGARSPVVVVLVGLTQVATAWGYASER